MNPGTRDPFRSSRGERPIPRNTHARTAVWHIRHRQFKCIYFIVLRRIQYTLSLVCLCCCFTVVSLTVSLDYWFRGGLVGPDKLCWLHKMPSDDIIFKPLEGFNLQLRHYVRLVNIISTWYSRHIAAFSPTQLITERDCEIDLRRIFQLNLNIIILLKKQTNKTIL